MLNVDLMTNEATFHDMCDECGAQLIRRPFISLTFDMYRCNLITHPTVTNELTSVIVQSTRLTCFLFIFDMYRCQLHNSSHRLRMKDIHHHHPECSAHTSTIHFVSVRHVPLSAS